MRLETKFGDLGAGMRCIWDEFLLLSKCVAYATTMPPNSMCVCVCVFVLIVCAKMLTFSPESHGKKTVRLMRKSKQKSTQIYLWGQFQQALKFKLRKTHLKVARLSRKLP